MIFDHRLYTTKPGMTSEHMKLYMRYGYEVQTEVLGQPVLYALTDTGGTNDFVHIWAYESFEERAGKRERLVADPRWTEYRKQYTAAGNLVHQQNSLLVQVPFVPFKR